MLNGEQVLNELSKEKDRTSIPILSEDQKMVLEKKIVEYLYKTYQDKIFISIMNQYTPMPQIAHIPALNRRISPEEYEEIIDYAIRIGIENGFIQEGETASESFIPAFDCEGI